MLFNSDVFLCACLPIALTGYFLLARFGRAPAALWLVAVSLVFYGWRNPAYVPLLVLSIGGNYLLSLLIGATEQRSRCTTGCWPWASPPTSARWATTRIVAG